MHNQILIISTLTKIQISITDTSQSDPTFKKKN